MSVVTCGRLCQSPEWTPPPLGRKDGRDLTTCRYGRGPSLAMRIVALTRMLFRFIESSLEDCLSALGEWFSSFARYISSSGFSIHRCGDGCESGTPYSAGQISATLSTSPFTGRIA